MEKQPLISIILMLKNGMPYLPQALNSISAQTYHHFELIVQDGVSTDGSLELIHQYAKDNDHFFRVKIESGKDKGISDAFNKALKRCKGKIIASIDSDNLLAPHALETIVARFKVNPEAAVIYSAQEMIHEDGSFAHYYFPKSFNILDFLECRLVPPFGSSFFSKVLCEGKLYADESLKTCADFNIWLNLSTLKILCIPDVLASTRISQNSMTCRPESYQQFCQDKITCVAQFFDKLERNDVNEALYKRSVAGIYAWAAESVWFFYPYKDEKLFYYFLGKAMEMDITSLRAMEVKNRHDEALKQFNQKNKEVVNLIIHE